MRFQDLGELQRHIQQPPARPTRKPAATLLLEPSAFSSDWDSRPDSAVLIGLRVPSESDTQSAIAESAKRAIELHDETEGRIGAFNDALLSMLVARSVCDPNDVLAVHPLLELPDEIVPLAFPPATIRHIFDAVEKLQIDTSPIYEEATDEEVATLCTRLSEGALGRAERVASKRARRFLRFVLDELS